MLTTSRISLVVIISEQTFSKCVCVCVCVSVLQQKQFEEAVQQVNNQGIVYAEIKHEVKEWIKLAVDRTEKKVFTRKTGASAQLLTYGRC